MSRLATLLMFCAWLLYGAMPAVGMPAMADPAMEQAMPMMQDHSQHRGQDPGRMAEMSKTQQPCAHGGTLCTTPFCAACLTLLPELSFGQTGRFVHAYPAPALMQALASPAPAPLTPPPRG